MKKNAFCSICTVNYSAYAATLNDSLRKAGHNEPHYVLIVDYDPKYKEIIEKFNFTPIFIDQLGIPKKEELIKKYSAFELSNVLKPFFMEWLLKNKTDINYLVYLDTDIYVYSRLDEVFDYADKNKNISVILTPHLGDYKTYNKSADYNVEILFMKAGLYNGGFYMLKNNSDSLTFLDWQKSKLVDHGYNAPNAYMFVDQKILDFAPVVFDFVGIYKNKTYNVGHWNFYENEFSFRNGSYYVGNDKLIFFHFSYLKIDEQYEIESLLCTIPLKKEPILSRISFEYWNYLKENNYKKIIDISYTYKELYTLPPLSFTDPLLSRLNELDLSNSKLNFTKSQLDSVNIELNSTKTELDLNKVELTSVKTVLHTTKSQLDATKSQLDTTKSQLDTTKSQLDTTKSQLDTTKSQLDLRVNELTAIYACRGWRIIVLFRKLFLWKYIKSLLKLSIKTVKKIKGLSFRSIKTLVKNSEKIVKNPDTKELDNLSPRSRKIYLELKTAIEKRKKNK